MATAMWFVDALGAGTDACFRMCDLFYPTDAVCQEEGVQGYPTLKLFLRNKKRPTTYKGERSASAMSEWVISEVSVWVVTWT